MNPGRAGDDADAITDALLRASRLLVAISVRSIASVDDTVTVPQFRLLVVLGTHGPTKLVALAERLGVNPSVSTRMVDRLIVAGLVDRQANTANRREVVIALTAAGTALIDRVMRERRTAIAGIVRRLPDHHRSGLVQTLEAFSDAGGEPPAVIDWPT